VSACAVRRWPRRRPQSAAAAAVPPCGPRRRQGRGVAAPPWPPAPPRTPHAAAAPAWQQGARPGSGPAQRIATRNDASRKKASTMLRGALCCPAARVRFTTAPFRAPRPPEASRSSVLRPRPPVLNSTEPPLQRERASQNMGEPHLRFTSSTMLAPGKRSLSDTRRAHTPATSAVSRCSSPVGSCRRRWADIPGSSAPNTCARVRRLRESRRAHSGSVHTQVVPLQTLSTRDRVHILAAQSSRRSHYRGVRHNGLPAAARKRVAPPFKHRIVKLFSEKSLPASQMLGANPKAIPGEAEPSRVTVGMAGWMERGPAWCARALPSLVPRHPLGTLYAAQCAWEQS